MIPHTPFRHLMSTAISLGNAKASTLRASTGVTLLLLVSLLLPSLLLLWLDRLLGADHS